MDFRRRLVFPTSVRSGNDQPVRVEVTLHTRFSRCTGPMALGELVYTTTLLPGEKVRLATTDRRSRFSFDSESNLSYRSEQMSEEQYRMSALRAFMSDQAVVDRGSDRSTDRSNWSFHGDASGSYYLIGASADVNASGSYNGEATRDYLREHKAHAEMSDHQSVEATRKAHSLSIGEVSTRAHQEGETEDHFEASSRVFSNPNQCHAMTFLFYRINKTEIMKFELVSVERRVLDVAAPTPVPGNPFRAVGQIASIPQEVPATKATRLEVEARGLASEAQYAEVLSSRTTAGGRLNFAAAPAFVATAELGAQQPLPKDVRDAALEEVDKQLVETGLIDEETRQVSKQARQDFGYERKTSLPTAGVIVKGCLDECNICEPDLQRKTRLELRSMELQNQLLARQIELLDKSQEYRCCPEGSYESDEVDED
jgi:hypothetical protein